LRALPIAALAASNRLEITIILSRCPRVDNVSSAFSNQISLQDYSSPYCTMPILGLREPGPSHPPHFSLEPLIRPNILALTPYRCARDDYSAGVLLDANENAIGPALPKVHRSNGDADGTADEVLSSLSDTEIASLNRYPSPTHDDLKRKIATFRGVPDENWVFLGVGSDEVIDMLYRVMCVPGTDRVITTPPTYGMYKVTANVNDVGVLEVPLVSEGGEFQLDEEAVRYTSIRGPYLKLMYS